VKAVRPEAIISLSLSKTSDDLVASNQDRMLAGKRADGTTMPEYSYRSVTVFGKEPGPIKLFDTGDFQSNIFVEVRGDKIFTQSRDSKNNMLEFDERYQPIFGLSGSFKSEYISVLKPVLINEFKKATGL